MMRLCPLLVLLVLAAPARSSGALGPDRAEFFETEIRPLLVERCGKCHGDEKPKAGLRLTSRAAILRGGEAGPAAVEGKPEESLIVQAVRYQDEPRMPPKEKLPDREVDVLARWVGMGLPWPDAPATPKAPTASSFRITEEQRRFWSFRPVATVAPPEVKDAAWPRSEIDRFLLAAIEAKGLTPAPPADRRTLIRRATFDLTGLPPTPEEVEAFEADGSPGAFERVVDRLLASPHYGERWGRHWLDLVRYADSRDARGIGGAADIGEAYRYRDWVVAAFNRDLPYDEFIVNQVAGDRLPADRPGEVNAEGLIATGLLTIGEWGPGDADKEKMMTDIADDQIDVVGRAFLGLTIACARCHDHKFDPIATEDYYGLAGIFLSTRILPGPGAKTAGSPLLRTPIVATAEPKPGPSVPVALAALEGGVPDSPHAGFHDARVHIRGNYRRLGDVVPRRFPRVLAGDDQPPITEGSGRLELARWIARAEHPMTARVMVNRIWQHHFGEGLVRTPSNFGKLGEPPTDPGLLDWLARAFVDSGWSVKAMHRAVMLTSAYQQSGSATSLSTRLDPENRLFGRFNRRRLEAEELRDSLLAVSGRLDRTPGGPSVRDLANSRRTLYLMTIRSDRSSFGPLFDAADPTAMVDRRTVSTVAPQALFLLNHPFVLDQSRALAHRVAAEAPGDDGARIHRLYALLYGRPPDAEEAAIGLAMLTASPDDPAWEAYCQVLLCTNEFAYVD